MSRLLVSIFIGLSLILGSCNTEEFEFKGEWVLRGGKLYVETLSVQGNIVVSNHFTDSDTSNLNIFRSNYPIEGLEIEELVINKTIWTFFPENRSISEFWLNKDSIHPYAVQQPSWDIVRIFEYGGEQQLGGSAKPISMISWDGTNMTVLVQETYASVGSVNIRYSSILEFEKVASW